MATIYYTCCTLDGSIATEDPSLDWLLSRDVDAAGPMAYPAFQERIGAAVMGATTWQWLLDHHEGAGHVWGTTPAWVMTHRTFPEAPAAVRFARGDVRRVHAEMTEMAAGKDLWIVGGGDLVGQLHDAGLLDEVWLQYAPVTLGRGAPVLPRHVELRLEEVARNRDLACLRHTVVR